MMYHTKIAYVLTSSGYGEFILPFPYYGHVAKVNGLRSSDRPAAPSDACCSAVHSRAARLSQVALVSAATFVGTRTSFPFPLHLIENRPVSFGLASTNHDFVRHASASGPPPLVTLRSVRCTQHAIRGESRPSNRRSGNAVSWVPKFQG